MSALYQAQTLDLLEEDLDQTLITLSREMTRENAFLEDGRVTDDEREFFAGDQDERIFNGATVARFVHRAAEP